MPKDSDNAVIRRAGLLERYHITRHCLALDSCVIMTARYLHQGKALHKDTLFPALRRVVEAHGALGVRLVGDSTNQPAFERLQSVDLAKVVEFMDDDADSLIQVIESQFMKRFDTNSAFLPLWRIAVLSDNTLIFAWHHAIGDGLSGRAFHRALFTALNTDNTSYNGSEVVNIPSNTSLTPELEKLVNLWPSVIQFAHVVFESFAPVALTQKRTAWTGSLVKMSTLETRVRLLEISPTENAKLVSVCRKNKATITPALQVLAVSVISQLLLSTSNSENSPSPKTISSSIPMSLRSLSGISQDVMCDNFSAYHSYPKLTPVFSWADASNLTATLRSFREKAAGEIGMLKFIFGQYESFFNDKVGKKRDCGFEVSNVGKFTIPEAAEQHSEGNWNVDRMVFAQCDVVTGAAVKMSVVGSPTGGLAIAVTWGPEAAEDALMDAFVPKFRKAFNELLEEE